MIILKSSKSSFLYIIIMVVLSKNLSPIMNSNRKVIVHKYSFKCLMKQKYAKQKHAIQTIMHLPSNSLLILSALWEGNCAAIDLGVWCKKYQICEKVIIYILH